MPKPSWCFWKTSCKAGRVKCSSWWMGIRRIKPISSKPMCRTCKDAWSCTFYPPYAPDLNPDEFVWSHMKNNGVSKKPLTQNESLQNRIDQDLNALKGNKKLVRSFF